MARPKKIGLDYFPVDVTFNEQVQALESIHKNDGLVWLLKFWQAAYKTEHGEVNLNGLFGSISANNSRITPEQQATIIADCIQLGLLIKISDGVYSSHGVRKRIGAVSKERQEAINRRKKELFGEQSPNNPRTMGESKGKESKGKESKDKTRPAKPADPRFKDFVEIFDRVWFLNREGKPGYSERDFAQLRAMLLKQPDATPEQFQQACDNCLLDGFYSKNLSLAFISSQYSKLLNFKKAVQDGKNFGNPSRFIGEFERNAAEKYKDM